MSTENRPVLAGDVGATLREQREACAVSYLQSVGRPIEAARRELAEILRVPHGYHPESHGGVVLAMLRAEVRRLSQPALEPGPLASGKVVAVGDKRIAIEWTDLSGIGIGADVDVMAAPGSPRRLSPALTEEERAAVKSPPVEVLASGTIEIAHPMQGAVRSLDGVHRWYMPLPDDAKEGDEVRVNVTVSRSDGGAK